MFILLVIEPAQHIYYRIRGFEGFLYLSTLAIILFNVQILNS